MSSPLFFISYRKSDAAEQAEQLYNMLSERYGSNRVFRDEKSLAPGDVWPVDLREKIIDAKAVIILIKDAKIWLGIGENNQRRIDNPEDWVRKEIEIALANNKNIIPIIIGSANLSNMTLPVSLTSLKNRQSVTISDLSLNQDGLITVFKKFDLIFAESHFLEDNLSEVIKIIRKMGIQPGDNETILAMTSARLAKLEKDVLNSIITDTEAKIERAKIRMNIHYLLDKIG